MNKHSSNIRKVKHFLLGAGLALTVTFAASSVFAQSLESSLIPCGSLGGKMVTTAECNASDKAAGITVCAPGQLPTPSANCIPGQQPGQQGIDPRQQQMQSGNFVIDDIAKANAVSEKNKVSQDLATGRLQAGQGMNSCMLLGNGYQMSVKDCLQSLNEIIAGKAPLMLLADPQSQFTADPIAGGNISPNVQNQQPLFGQQQFGQQQEGQPGVNLVRPTSKASASIKKKGIALADKLLSTLVKKFNAAKTENKRKAAVRSVAKQIPKVWKYVESAYGEIDETIFDLDSLMADIADELKSDADSAFETTQYVLESIKQILEQ